MIQPEQVKILDNLLKQFTLDLKNTNFAKVLTGELQNLNKNIIGLSNSLADINNTLNEIKDKIKP